MLIEIVTSLLWVVFKIYNADRNFRGGKKNFSNCIKVALICSCLILTYLSL